MKGKAKRRGALTSAVAAASALVLAAGLSLPTTLAFAGGDAEDPERPAEDVADVLLDEGEADQAAEVANAVAVADVDEADDQNSASEEGEGQNGASDGQESEADPSAPEQGAAPDDELAQEHPSPYNEDGSLKPHTVSNGVLTFDDPALGSWYALNVETGEGVDCAGVVYGGGVNWEMTIRADQLDPNDEGYSADPYHGPFFVRGNNGGAYSSIAFEVEGEDGWTEDMKLLQGSLSPSGAGTISTFQSPRIWAVQLNAPATLYVSVAGEGTAVSVPIAVGIPGATATIPAANLEEQRQLSALTLVSGELDEGQVAGAEGAVIAVLGDPLNVKAFDLHLQDPSGAEVPVPDGKTVTVTLPIPEDWTIGDVRVLHVADDGAVTDMNATVNAAERTVTFATTHFSTFVMANYPAKTVDQASDTVKPLDTDDASDLAKTGDSQTPLAAVAAVAALAAAGAAGIALRRRG